jgi:hypothetical protein
MKELGNAYAGIMKADYILHVRVTNNPLVEY